MRKKRWLFFPLSGMLLLAVVVGLYGCPQMRPSLLDEIGLRPGNSGFTNLLLGEERLVALKMGNLSETAATDAQDRLNILAEFLQTYAEFFGVPTTKANDLMVLAAAPEQQAVVGMNEDHQTVMVNQEFEGAIVLDGQVFGEYVRVADRNWQLRRVQGRLFDPASLVAPVASNDDTLGLAAGLFEEFLVQNEFFEGGMNVLPTPVILGAENLAGFLCNYMRTYDDGSMDRMAAVVNPLTDQLHVVYYIPACRAHNAFGDAS